MIAGSLFNAASKVAAANSSLLPYTAMVGGTGCDKILTSALTVLEPPILMVKAAILLDRALCAAGTSTRVIDRAWVALMQAVTICCGDAAILDRTFESPVLAQPAMSRKENEMNRILCMDVFVNSQVNGYIYGASGSIVTD